jgi:hypothetical protein
MPVSITPALESADFLGGQEVGRIVFQLAKAVRIISITTFEFLIQVEALAHELLQPIFTGKTLEFPLKFVHFTQSFNRCFLFLDFFRRWGDPA